ncbi:unnamed protein product, partial [Rotaria magnacalcarata]
MRGVTVSGVTLSWAHCILYNIREGTFGSGSSTTVLETPPGGVPAQEACIYKPPEPNRRADRNFCADFLSRPVLYDCPIPPPQRTIVPSEYFKAVDAGRNEPIFLKREGNIKFSSLSSQLGGGEADSILEIHTLNNHDSVAQHLAECHNSPEYGYLGAWATAIIARRQGLRIAWQMVNDY